MITDEDSFGVDWAGENRREGFVHEEDTTPTNGARRDGEGRK